MQFLRENVDDLGLRRLHCPALLVGRPPLRLERFEIDGDRQIMSSIVALTSAPSSAATSVAFGPRRAKTPFGQRASTTFAISRSRISA